MKKVGIITFYKKNYGAFLQAYALQKVIKDLGHMPEAMNYNFSAHSVISDLTRNPLYFVKKTIFDFVSRKKIAEKVQLFRISIRKHLNETSTEYKSKKSLKSCAENYDVYLTGSDQVWNPMIFPDNLCVRLLNFASQDKIIASYAASISAKTITERDITKIREGLARFDYISVREESTKKIIGTIPGKEIHVHVDPCLLLKPEQWADIAEEPEVKNYLLVYKLMSQPGMNDFIKRIADENNLKVISIGKLNGYNGEYIHIPFTSPEKFLGYFQCASYIVTNSFHGVVFSIINKKRATFFLPAASYDRALNLIQKTGTDALLEQRYLSDDEIERAYKDVDSILDKERTDSIRYLSKVLNAKHKGL